MSRHDEHTRPQCKKNREFDFDDLTQEAPDSFYRQEHINPVITPYYRDENYIDGKGFQKNFDGLNTAEDCPNNAPYQIGTFEMYADLAKEQQESLSPDVVSNETSMQDLSPLKNAVSF